MDLQCNHHSLGHRSQAFFRIYLSTVICGEAMGRATRGKMLRAALHTCTGRGIGFHGTEHTESWAKQVSKASQYNRSSIEYASPGPLQQLHVFVLMSIVRAAAHLFRPQFDWRPPVFEFSASRHLAHCFEIRSHCIHLMNLAR